MPLASHTVPEQLCGFHASPCVGCGNPSLASMPGTLAVTVSLSTLLLFRWKVTGILKGAVSWICDGGGHEGHCCLCQ